MVDRSRPLLSLLLGAALAVSGTLAACDDGGSSTGTGSTSSAQGGGGGVTTGEGGSGAGFQSTSSSVGGGPVGVLDVQPSAMQTITVPIGQQTPTVTYTATYSGQPANAAWNVDKGNIGTVTPGPGSTTVFTPSGTTGGVVNVVAGLNQATVSRSIQVNLQGTQNGYDPNNPAQVAQVPTSVADLTDGGGVGGVGGEGLGPGVTDAGTLTALDNPVGDGSAEGLTLLYPYDATVFPRGLLAPNLMWRWTNGDADAVKIELTTTSAAFHWTGTFAKPAILSVTGKPFIRHPIPQDIWKMATNTAGGADKLIMKLTVAKAGQAYGPITNTWTIAPARLSGIIYYNSYGSQLAKNYTGAVGGNGEFGGAVLSIHAGDTGPQLAAGTNSLPSFTGCRVCHSVAANGSRLIAQQGDNSTASSAYDLTPMGTTEIPLANGAQFPAVFPDGSMMLGPDANLYPLPNTSPPTPTTGLTTLSTQLGTPAFSPDGKQVVFNPLSSVGNAITTPKQSLMVMDFDPMAFTFANAVKVVDYSGQSAEVRPGWGAFFPDGKSVIFHTQLAAGVDGNNLGDLRSRKGARAEISWTRTTDSAAVTPLNRLNGKDASGNSYLPTLLAPVALACTGDGAQVGNIDNTHANDVQLNYEPTVNPVASGGYAWVVFTSRRMYGSVADIPPFCSDPRGVNLINNVTTKKLWVAAVDLSGQPGTDASHPAFYLPGQELLAGNSRGFWTLDPCKMDGDGCQAGDECCNGYCQPDGDGDLVCSNIPPDAMCSQPQEVCTTAADCCDVTNLCINGFCTLAGPG